MTELSSHGVVVNLLKEVSAKVSRVGMVVGDGYAAIHGILSMFLHR